MRRISTVGIFKITFALAGFILIGQVLLFALCRCRETEENPLASNREKSARDLTDQVQQLTENLRRLEVDNEKLSKENKALAERNKAISRELSLFKTAEKITISQELSHERSQVAQGEFLKAGRPVRSEYEVVPFDAVAYNAIYQLDHGLADNPAEKPYGFKGKDYSEALKFATNTLNQDFEGRDMDTFARDIVDGIVRVDRLYGSQYDFYFRTSNPYAFRRVKLQRPFGPLTLVDKVETIVTKDELINVILPLSGRIDKFKTFLDNFVDVGIRWDASVFLTVVFHGQEGKQDLESLLKNMSKAENFSNYKIVFSDEPFSRGLALQKGVLSWDRGTNVLMFFCDVDVFFTAGYLNRCRFHSAPGSKVYYPVVFSLYNPMVVYGGSPPPIANQYRINRDTGFWRTFGFGMTCQYRNDFLNTGGFDLSIKGWGMEDVKLYRNYLAKNLIVIRATDRGIFHIWHPKHCSRNLTERQYLACIKSKVKSEASHSQLGLLAFGGKIFDEEEPNWIEQLQESKTKKFTNKKG